MAEFSFRYGRAVTKVKLPGGLDLSLITGKPMPALPSVLWELRRGLADPFGCAPLRVQARNKHQVLIVVGDYTRYHAYAQWLPALLDEINAAGVPDFRIRLYVGCGTHRGMTDAEKLERPHPKDPAKTKDMSKWWLPVLIAIIISIGLALYTIPVWCQMKGYVKKPLLLRLVRLFVSVANPDESQTPTQTRKVSFM